jgi:hypothetical protein
MRPALRSGSNPTHNQEHTSELLDARSNRPSYQNQHFAWRATLFAPDHLVRAKEHFKLKFYSGNTIATATGTAALNTYRPSIADLYRTPKAAFRC